jgi:hypothetical protein
LACDGRPVPDFTPYSVVAGSGNEVMEFPALPEESKKVKSGYYIGEKDYLLVNIDFVNYREEDRDLYMEAEIEYVPGRPYPHASMRQIPVGVCDSLAAWGAATNIHTPKGQTKFTMSGKKDIEILKDGYLTQTGT